MTALVKHHRHALAILIIFWHVTASAQLTSNFSASPLSGCSPLVVNFSDLSTGNPNQWRWDLGNGVISTLKNPSATYFNPGTYNVKLVVRNAAGSADSITKNQFITVYGNPAVGFLASDTTGCFPLPVQFTDQSTAGSGTIISWQWDFGDGTLSSQKSPSHVYASAGNFTVTLKVTNSLGCVKTVSRTQYIKVSNGVTANFTNNVPGLCTAPVIIQFTNTSSGPGSLTYVWDFGDGSSSTATDPSHNYVSNGNYTVTLVAISPQGCKDTIKKQNLLNIGTNQSGFSAPDSICQNQYVSFFNTSVPTPSSAVWYFGDGSTSSSINPVTAYANSGTFTIKLVNNFGSCSDSISKQIVVVTAPLVNFTADKTSACQLPVTIQYQAQNPGNNSLVWLFGDGTSSTAQNPAHIYTSEGSFTVTLIATNPFGCSDTLVKTDFINIQKPNIQITGLPRTGCAPVTITPTATITSGQTIQSYLWKFGDGTTSSSATPSHTYSAGTYTVTLIITTTTGCVDSIVLLNAVQAGNKPNANFSANPTDVCAYRPIQFTDLSTGNVNQWHWIFGDGYTSDEQNPKHEYSDTGWFNVQLIVWNNTCPDTIKINNAVHIKPPIASFMPLINCTDKYKVVFEDHSIGATTWNWDFADGTTSNQQNPTHTYTSAGTYLVGLYISNGSCTHYTTRIVKIIDEKANFTSDSVKCKNSFVDFGAFNINPDNVANWNWNFGDGNTSMTPIAVSHPYYIPGVYTITLTITDSLGCIDIFSKPLRIYGPTADFIPNASAVCIDNNNVTFTDASIGDGTHPVIKWIWNYGDGIIDSVDTPPYQHQYLTPGTYDVSLTIRDNLGCVDQITKPAAIIISKPVADFFSLDSISCTNKSIVFTNTSSATSPVYEWTFGDGTQSSDVHPSHNYASIGAYSISLKVTDQYGCRDSITKTEYINISYPKAAFIMSDSFGTCPPLIVNFTNQSADYVSANWDFGDGTFSALKDPSHFYNAPGIYYPILTVTGPGGCTDSFSRRIEVKGPYGSFTYAPLSGCKPLTVTFTASTQNTASFIWDFSDGTTLATTDSIVSHTYTTTGDYVPKMILIDPGGCNFPITGKDTIRVYAATAAFEMNTNKLCNDGTIQFTNTTISNDLLASYQWNFGDGTSSSAANPSHHYSNLGAYTVQLIVTTANGCKDSVSLTDTIRVLQSPVIAISGDSAACIPASFTFNGIIQTGNAATMTWNWDMGNGQTANEQDPPSQTYNTAGNYLITAIATADNGCRDTASKSVELYSLPVTNAGPDLAICLGTGAQLNATGATTFVWNNSSLSCTNCSSPLAAPTGSTLYVVTGYNSFGCSASDSVLVKVHQPFVLNVEPGDTICVGGSVNLSAMGADLYSWSPASSLTTPDKATTIAKPQTSTTYQVVAKDLHNCFTDTAEVFIKVWAIPTVNAGIDQNIVVGNSIQLQSVYSNDVTSWQWNNGNSLSCFNCPAPIASPKQTTSYTIQVKNDGGCIATDQVTVFVTCNNGNLFIPNTFSPNGDGANDRFYPNGKGINMIRSLRVYNRWGEIVFERANFNANDQSAGWDGTYKGQQLAPDVYVYTCDVVCLNNEVLTYKGDVTLLR